jgi:NAD(P)H dehydrogenase (quinone)
VSGTEFAIFGATGKVGRATVRALRERGERVRAIVRATEQTAPLADLGCEIVVGDLRDPKSIAAAITGADAVQVICPTLPQHPDAAYEMRRTVEKIAEGLRTAAPRRVVAISDYGAELVSGTGVTLIFHALEQLLAELASYVTFLRSAEQMENWGRQIPVALETGVLPSMHHPVSKLFPTVAAADVGRISAELLREETAVASPQVIHVEGPRRYSAVDVAAAASTLSGRTITVKELPRRRWRAALEQAGISPSYANLVVDLFAAHNAGRIDAEGRIGEIRRGTTELQSVLARLIEGAIRSQGPTSST